MAHENRTVSRRGLLGGALAGGTVLAMPAILRAAPMMETLAFHGPPAGPSITLAHAVATEAFAGIAATASFATWKDPDELRAGLASGTMGAVILPTLVAANLYTRGQGVRLVNIMTDGLVYIVSSDRAIGSGADLAGRRLALPFRNDTPDILLRELMIAAGVDADAADIVAASNPIEAVQLLLTGRADAAVLPEPAATMAEMKAAQEGKSVTRVIDMQAAWGEITGAGASIPQAGLGVTADFTAAHPEAPAAIQSILAEVVESVIADPVAAAASAADLLGMPAPVLARSIPHSALTATPASEARPALEAMFTAVADSDPRIIGGALPDDGFYLL